MPELLGICDRIIVLSNGQLSGEIDLKNDPENANQETIMRYATKYI